MCCNKVLLDLILFFINVVRRILARERRGEEGRGTSEPLRSSVHPSHFPPSPPSPPSGHLRGYFTIARRSKKDENTISIIFNFGKILISKHRFPIVIGMLDILYLNTFISLTSFYLKIIRVSRSVEKTSRFQQNLSIECSMRENTEILLFRTKPS